MEVTGVTGTALLPVDPEDLVVSPLIRASTSIPETLFSISGAVDINWVT